jgi:hypothetical protein
MAERQRAREGSRVVHAVRNLCKRPACARPPALGRAGALGGQI